MKKEQFVYKKKSLAFVHGDNIHILRKSGEKTLYYMYNASLPELKAGEVIEINYKHTIPFKDGKMLMEDSVNE